MAWQIVLGHATLFRNKDNSEQESMGSAARLAIVSCTIIAAFCNHMECPYALVRNSGNTVVAD
jgi:hypothetical protein